MEAEMATRDATGAQNADPRARRPPTVSHLFGELVWLMTQSPLHRHLKLADLEWLLMPALLAEQVRIFHGDDGRPLGAALWANLDGAGEAKLQAGEVRLDPGAWTAGDRTWLVDLVAPFATSENRMVERMLADLVETALKGRRLRFHHTDVATGRRVALEIGDDGIGGVWRPAVGGAEA